MQQYVFLKENLQFGEVDTITEGPGDNKDLYICGPFVQADVENRNGRVYPLDVMQKAVESFKKEKVSRKTGQLFAPGELSHPPDRGAEIDPERICMYITELNMDGKNGMGKAKVGTAPMGMVLRNLIHDGLDMGVSSRGLGRVEEEKGRKIVKEFQLCTVDAVIDPSAPEAYVDPVNEGIQYFLDESTNEMKMVTAIERLLAEIKESLTVLPKDSVMREEKMSSVLDLALKGLEQK